MTANEIICLIYGIALGATVMSVMQAWWAAQDARRSRAKAEAARRRAAGDRYLASLRLYQLRQRRMAPHPAEVLEAAVRDFELDLRDGLDRVERAARDEGLL
ncbi:hypothetical protein [Streptomyces sp. NPDC005890]|uniref:hypothetical protein n=1 Tax=Streptomyces sp. NPDC005890 TaxID=3154568 RepID=UPI0033DA8406